MDFNPRSHERSDVTRCELLQWYYISIHAPTRGATYPNLNLSINIRISIHAPTRGATGKRGGNTTGNRYFNPRSHERSDGSDGLDYGFVSNFNPRSHERSDVKSKSKKGWCIIFQSTLPREERRMPLYMDTIYIYFNPRSHERSDLSGFQPILLLLFQSTLPREERQRSDSAGFHKWDNFNPRSHERSDLPPALSSPGTIISIHAPTRGATLSSNGMFLMVLVFQSTLPREERQNDFRLFL